MEKCNIKMPTISVLMSTFNREKVINKAIKSIIFQTYKNFEFIICNDGSTDRTLQYLRYWQKRDNRIKILNNKHNLGLQQSLNRCLRYSSGKYIARMDDDDISLPNRFKAQLLFLRQHSNISFVGSNVMLFDTKYGNLGKSHFIHFPNKYQLFKKDEFCHPSIMIRANILKKNHGYSLNKRYFRIEDYELWLRLYSFGYKGANLNQILLRYTFNIHSHRSKFYDYFNRFRLLKDYKKLLHINIKGYIYILLPLIKILVPSILRNYIYSIKYARL